MTARIRSLLAATVALVIAATVAVAAVPGLDFAYRGEAAHIVIETSATLVSLLIAFILLGRVRQAPSRGELLLFVGLLLLFAANLARSVAPSYTGENEAVVWAPLTLNVIAAAVLAWSALAPGGEAVAGRRPRARLPAGLLAVAALAVLVVYLLSDRLPVGIDPAVHPAESDAVLVTGSPGLLVVQLASMALFGLAAVGFARRAERSRDELLAWLAIGMALGSLSRLNYFLFPSIYSEWVFTGDILRFASYFVILVGALRQIAAYQRTAAAAARVAERTRIAADLHDGLVQDLAFIAMQSERMAAEDERVTRMASAARRALAESRGVIENLRITDAPLVPALTSVARGLARRHPVNLVLDLDEAVETTPQVRDQLLRIASEAISNSVRHGSPTEIRVRLAEEVDGLRLAISDDGAGFDPSAGEGGEAGLGLRGMRERAERLGGGLDVRSRPGEGTRVEVVVP